MTYHFRIQTASGGIVNTSQWASHPQACEIPAPEEVPRGHDREHVVRRLASGEWPQMSLASRHRESLRNK